MEGTSKITQSPHPCHRQGHLSLDIFQEEQGCVVALLGGTRQLGGMEAPAALLPALLLSCVAPCVEPLAVHLHLGRPGFAFPPALPVELGQPRPAPAPGAH